MKHRLEYKRTDTLRQLVDDINKIFDNTVFTTSVTLDELDRIRDKAQSIIERRTGTKHNSYEETK